MTVLIRGKFPGRRKRISQNNSFVYVYQDLKLINKKNSSTSVHNMRLVPPPSVNPQNLVFSSFDNVCAAPPRPVIMTQPNLNPVAVCSPTLNNVFNYQAVPYMALQVLPSVNTAPYEPISMKQNLNLRLNNPVNMTPTFSVNPGMPYTILQNAPPTVVQPFKAPPEKAQTGSQATFQTLKIPLINENFSPCAEQALRMPHVQPHSSISTLPSLRTHAVHGQNSLHTSTPSVMNQIVQGPYSFPPAMPSVKSYTVQKQNAVPASKQTMKNPTSNRQNTFPSMAQTVRTQAENELWPNLAKAHPLQTPLLGQNIPAEGSQPKRIAAACCPISKYATMEAQNVSPQNRKSTHNHPVGFPSNPKRNFVPVAGKTKDSPSSTSCDDSDDNDQQSSSASLSPLMRIIKEESNSDDSNSDIGDGARSQTLESGYKNKNPSCIGETIETMINDILPDMDVDDYISEEFLGSSNKQETGNIQYKKSNKEKCPIMPEHFKTNTMRNFVDWVEKRTNMNEVSSSAASLPVRMAKPVSSANWNKDISFTSEAKNNTRTGNAVCQEKSSSFSENKIEKRKRTNKTWDEDIRRNLSESGFHTSFNSSSVNKHKNLGVIAKKAPLSLEQKNDAYEPTKSNDHVPQHVKKCDFPTEKRARKFYEFSRSTVSMNSRTYIMPEIPNRDRRCVDDVDFGNRRRNSFSLQASRSFPQYSQQLPSESHVKHLHFNQQAHGSILPPICDPSLQQVASAVMHKARQLLHDAGQSITELEIARQLESALYQENPAILYTSEKSLANFNTHDNSGSLFCCATHALKEISRNPLSSVNQLLHHHQSCHGLGCFRDCQTLRAAYIHIYLFRHRCPIWTTFFKIFGRHAKACRVARCQLTLCLFMKHELHIGGISVLPIQFMEERSVVEEQFRRCEAVGPHTHELQCRHVRSSCISLNNPCCAYTGAKNSQCSQSFDVHSLRKEMSRSNITSESLFRMLEIIGQMTGLNVPE